MVFIVPTRTDIEDYEIEVELSGVSFLLRFTWNYREEFWYLTISDADANIIAAGIKIVISKPLLLEVPGTEKPDGNLIAIDTSDENVEAGLTDLGDRVLLMWDGT
jgi:hypothetical protein